MQGWLVGRALRKGSSTAGKIRRRLGGVVMGLSRTPTQKATVQDHIFRVDSEIIMQKES